MSRQSEADEPAAALPVKSVAATAAESASWRQFRGDSGQGRSSAARLPCEWSETRNILWKRPVVGAGWSSPVIDGNELWVTATTDAGKSVRAICVDRRTGRTTLISKPLFEIDDRSKIHPQNGPASPTPVLDGERVFIRCGAYGTVCLDRAGKALWKCTLPYYHHHGPGASPVLAGDTLIVVCDGFTGPHYDKLVRKEVGDLQFVAGLDAATGEVRWKTPRTGRHSYCTPLVIDVAGLPQVVCPGGDRVCAYDPRDGRELWSCRYNGYSVVPRPVAANGLVFVCTGYDTASLLAIRQGASGDCTETHVAWRTDHGIPFLSSPIVVGEHLFFVSDHGVLSCLESATGKVVWKKRLGGHFAASPIVAGDRLYFAGESGTVHVVRAGPKFEELARNQLEAKFLASPAVAENQLYLRSERHLYCIGEGPSEGEAVFSPPLQGASRGGEVKR